MNIEGEERFCKVARRFPTVLERLHRAAASGEAAHEVEERTWFGLLEVGREMIVAYVEQQDEALPRPRMRFADGVTCGSTCWTSPMGPFRIPMACRHRRRGPAWELLPSSATPCAGRRRKSVAPPEKFPARS
jgi:hypothetical protein